MGKLRILAVENDPEWLGLILRLFPEYVVKPIRYYVDALPIVDAEDMVYHVAIVDLNLIDPPAHQPPGRPPRDMLGGELLRRLYEAHPATLRIALTGAPPRGPMLKRLVGRYHVDEFFMKQEMDPEDLRSLVLDSPAAKAAALEPAVPGLEAQVADQRDRLQAWAEVRLAQLEQQMKVHQNDLRAAGRAAESDADAAAKEAALRSAMQRLADRLAAIPGNCARIEGILDRAGSAADVRRAAREIDRLMGTSGAAAAS